MLFLLTGDVQIGKTRWLGALADELLGAGVDVAGVVAPGVWRERSADEPDGQGGLSGRGRFEKLGIDNVLLPGGDHVPFARRRDLALAAGELDENSQAGRAKLGWAISDAAIARVDAHFARISEQLGAAGASASPACTGLLVVDELGQLELNRGEGLVHAVSLLDGGPSERFGCAIVVVRDWLEPRARERFAPVWGEVRDIGPDDASKAAVLSALGLAASL